MKRTRPSVNSKRALHDLQKTFFRIISRPLKPGHRMRPSPETAHFIAPSSKLTPHERLELYAQQYWWRLIDSLRDDFPKLESYLGEKDFSALLIRYLKKSPSDSYSLRNLGLRMPEFIAKDRVLPLAKRTGGAQIATIELAQQAAFDSASVSPLRVEDLSKNPDTLCVTLQPYVQILPLSVNADTLFEDAREVPFRTDASNIRKRATRAPARRRRARSLRRCAITVAIYRQQRRIYVCRLTPVEIALARALREGGNLTHIVSRTVRILEKPLSADEIREVFGRFAFRGWIGTSSKKIN
jgi:hypothetical protein